MGLPEKRTPPPILRTLKLETGGSLMWMLREDGGLELGYGGAAAAVLTEQEFRWFLDDITKPTGPVYRGGGLVSPSDRLPDAGIQDGTVEAREK